MAGERAGGRSGGDDRLFSEAVQEWLDGLPHPQRGYAYLRWRRAEERLPAIAGQFARDVRQGGLAGALAAVHARLVIAGFTEDEATDLLVRVLAVSA